jgi:hypothetical protein
LRWTRIGFKFVEEFVVYTWRNVTPFPPRSDAKTAIADPPS